MVISKITCVHLKNNGIKNKRTSSTDILGANNENTLQLRKAIQDLKDTMKAAISNRRLDDYLKSEHKHSILSVYQPRLRAGMQSCPLLPQLQKPFCPFVPFNPCSFMPGCNTHRSAPIILLTVAPPATQSPPADKSGGSCMKELSPSPIVQTPPSFAPKVASTFSHEDVNWSLQSPQRLALPAPEEQVDTDKAGVRITVIPPSPESAQRASLRSSASARPTSPRGDSSGQAFLSPLQSEASPGSSSSQKFLLPKAPSHVSPQRQSVSRPGSVSEQDFVSPQQQTITSRTGSPSGQDFVSPQQQTVSSRTGSPSGQDFVSPQQQMVSSRTGTPLGQKFASPQHQTLSPAFGSSSSQKFLLPKAPSPHVSPQQSGLSPLAGSSLKQQFLSPRSPAHVSSQSQEQGVFPGSSQTFRSMSQSQRDASSEFGLSDVINTNLVNQIGRAIGDFSVSYDDLTGEEKEVRNLIEKYLQHRQLVMDNILAAKKLRELVARLGPERPDVVERYKQHKYNIIEHLKQANQVHDELKKRGCPLRDELTIELPPGSAEVKPGDDFDMEIEVYPPYPLDTSNIGHFLCTADEKASRIVCPPKFLPSIDLPSPGTYYGANYDEMVGMGANRAPREDYDSMKRHYGDLRRSFNRAKELEHEYKAATGQPNWDQDQKERKAVRDLLDSYFQHRRNMVDHYLCES